MSTEVRPTQPGQQLRSAWVAVALSPVGFIASLLVMLAVSTVLGLPILTAGDDVIMGGTREPTLLGTLLVIGAGAATALALPVYALVQSLRARRAGHPNTTAAAVAAGALIVLVVVLPPLWQVMMGAGSA
ncbi:MAG TPA: hypothetical protein VFL38_10990 [Humibacillus xanthopallidus]|nr:hypothetical protein [Humibacillus xanthopallidus]